MYRGLLQVRMYMSINLFLSCVVCSFNSNHQVIKLTVVVLVIIIWLYVITLLLEVKANCLMAH